MQQSSKRIELIHEIRHIRSRLIHELACRCFDKAKPYCEHLKSLISNYLALDEWPTINSDDLTDELIKSLDSIGAVCSDNQLITLGAYVAQWLASEPSSNSTLSKEPLWPLLAAVKNEDELLTVLTSLWHQAHLFSDKLPAVFDECDPDELAAMIPVFSRSDFVSLYLALYYFSQNPQKLFEKKLPAEKLLSVSHRLDEMYHFILVLQQQFLTCCQEIIHEPVPDYLFHGEGLPMGIHLNVSPENRQRIINGLKSWTPRRKKATEQELYQQYVHDLGLSYTYWFNPDRLIDACMMLNQLAPKNTSFQAYMQQCYQSLSTTQCMHLYGYFSNKDTTYLMRTIKNASMPDIKPWLGEITLEEQSLLAKVYQNLYELMSALRDTLKERHIDTEPYSFINHHKADKPRQRNRDAIRRILAVYLNPVMKQDDDLLEQLFLELS